MPDALVATSLRDRMTEQTSQIMGAADSHDTLRRKLAQHRPCKILDAAAGQGALAAFLRDRGWDVHCADIAPDNFRIEGISVLAADLNRRLPYADAEFDAVVCANAIHRLFNPAGAMREFFRILRPGGRLFLNANNYATIDTRLRFLLFGSLEGRDREQGIDPVGQPEANVRVHWTYPQLANYLEAAGFEIVDVQAAAVRWRNRLLAPLGWPIRCVAWLVHGERRRRNRLNVTSSPAVLTGGYYMYIEAVKPS